MKSAIKIVRNIVRVAFVRYCVGFVAIVLAGCAGSRFEVIDPPSMTHAIDGSTDVVGSSQGIIYHATVVDGLVVLRVENATSQSLELSHSTLVDPDGVRRPLETQPLPAGSFVKLILPPPPPDPTGGPLLTIDLSGNAPRRTPEQNWGWPAGKVVTLELSFARPDGSRFEQSLRIRRVRG